LPVFVKRRKVLWFCIFPLVLTTVAVADLAVWCEDANATVRELECREWTDKKYVGLYKLDFDDLTRRIVVSESPTQAGLFGSEVREWHVLFAHMPRLVVFGVEKGDWAAPVKVISMDFSQPRMFTYDMGGPIEGDKLISVVERECRRVD
jgi:hypothetical protein